MRKNEVDFDLFARKNAQIIAIVDLVFGDSGKGKLADLLAGTADITVRGTGGANAGHTIMISGEKFVFNLLSSGITRDKEGKISVIGRGTVIDPASLEKELAGLTARGMSWNGLRVSQDAQVVLPIHRVLDRLYEELAQKGKIGTTGRGIGPCYTDHRARIGVQVNDLLNRDILVRKVRTNLERHRVFLHRLDPLKVKDAVEAIDKELYHPTHFVDADAVVEYLLKHADVFAECITDTDALLISAVRTGKRVLLEGSQGVLLSVDYGTYPYVTSCDTSLSGLALGSGLSTDSVDYALSVMKAYTTRVGEGPFPTELADEEGEALRVRGHEYGATTGRSRGVGCLDLPLLRYAIPFSSASFALMKSDCLLKDGESAKLCTHYRYDGPEYRAGEKLYRAGDIVHTALPYADFLENCTPVYREMDGWKFEGLNPGVSKNALPSSFLKFIDVIEQETLGRVDVLSYGAEREETMFF